ncbi:MAG: copper-transporting ATPase [Candidatus Buchananbacteria bacterium CG10_big_fil_rev_8_21_14_0_10_42_9]|uniref:Copper-transporting ATPase n=1 Tax=Candidatus Buchananbacteria bacterium CG10_big_fil_rev_8_21_14_0_10_42_9 TaxID=1974526 RepID=A0A2H0W041_9BACT|nr:MAG: copper-transporting ATPase [Candidatus Buchananbacteria bacterium CG10_big_fil_rev_8_21_14_0_10_42_9]
MQIIGIVLILAVIALYALWIRFTLHQSGVVAKESGGTQTFDILVKGVYSPSVLRVKAGRPVKIHFRREESTECSRYVNFPDYHIRKELPEGKTVTIEFTPEKKGEQLFTCDMSMYQGKLIVE